MDEKQYRHGTSAEFVDSITTIPAQSQTNLVYVGTAPVNLVKGWEGQDLVNVPVALKSSTKRKLGYSADWRSFSLCEAINLHFENEIQKIGPIVAINVLDPNKHRKEGTVTKELLFVNNLARI